MVFIIGDKAYDTKKSEKVIGYIESYPSECLGYKFYARCSATLYRTDKGNWFSVREYQNKFIATKNNEDGVKNIFKELNSVEKYNKYFDEIEEA